MRANAIFNHLKNEITMIKKSIIILTMCMACSLAAKADIPFSEVYVGTLKDIETNCVQGMRIQITDDLVGVWAIDDTTRKDAAGLHFHYVFCRDLSNADPDVCPKGMTDFVKQAGLMGEGMTEWDNSNWIILDVSNVCCVHTQEGDPRKAEDFVGTIFNLSGITMNYTEMINYEARVINATDLDELLKAGLKEYSLEVEGEDQPIVPYIGWTDDKDEPQAHYCNTYITSNFIDEYHGANSTAYNSDSTKHYWFKTPKIGEVAFIEWARYGGEIDDEQVFIVPGTYSIDDTTTSNASKLKGAIEVVDWDFNKTGEDDNKGGIYGEPLVAVDTIYHFHAIIVNPEQPYDADAPRYRGVKRRAAGSGASENYGIYPLNIFKNPNDNKPTTDVVDKVGKPSAAKSITFYNLMGVPSRLPYDGVNIRVITYDDGSIVTDKLIF